MNDHEHLTFAVSHITLGKDPRVLIQSFAFYDHSNRTSNTVQPSMARVRTLGER